MRSRLAVRGWPAERRVDPPGSLDAVDVATARVLDHVDRWRADGRAERLFLVHARPTTGLRFEPYALQLLPLDPSWLGSLRDRAWPSRRLPVPFDDGGELLRGVVRHLIAHALVRAFAASQASENAARLAAMDAAERNIEERIDRLRTAYQAARQNAITEELLDIQAAYAATAPEVGAPG
jgi:F-type H+-transporting ATPase subunit gamma